MHAFFHTKAAQRRSIWAANQRKPAPVAVPTRVMQLTVETASVTALRQTVTRVCGDTLEFMRIEACQHGERMKVWLCVSEPMVAEVMAAVMHALPGAEFGRFAQRDEGGSRKEAAQDRTQA